MRLRRSALSFLLLTGLSLGALSPARAAEDPSPVSASASGDDGDATPAEPDADAVADAVGQTADEAERAADGGLSVPTTHEEAQASLAEVKDLFSPMSRTEAQSKLASGESRDATLALRDLSLRMGALSRTDRTSAYEEFQRPSWASDPTVSDSWCPPTGNICLHWIRPGATGYTGRTTDPTWAINTVYPVLTHVSQSYVAAGYRTPRSDVPPNSAPLGGSPQTDIYLDDVGREGKYGYCTVDLDANGRPLIAPTNVHSSDLPAFCVLDNDYSKSQFPTARTSTQDLEVTAAHEYFHAVQFAYDFLEDRWFMEATATWAEDQVYDDINDNVQYLRASQLRYPGVPLDKYAGAGGFLHYGDWVFFEYLTERIPARQGLLPVLVRRMWDYADSVRGRDYYSIQAVAAALAERHVDFRRIFGQYAAANRHPATAYVEGAANHYPTTRPRRTARLRPGHRTASGSYRVNHLASATVRFVPKQLPRKRTRLSVSVNMADKRTGSVAVALVYFRSGRVTTKVVRIGKHGNGRVRVPFGSRQVSRVEITLANANRAYKNCSNNVSGYSCGGVSRRDHVLERYSAKVS